MKLEYYRCTTGNFGDDLNAWLWPKIIPELLEKQDNNHLIGIGTILNADFNHFPANKKKIVFSSGTGYITGAQIDDTWDIIGVRGKKTAEIYNLSSDKALCDGAYLLRRVTDQADFSKGGKIGFMPHHLSIELFDWPSECQKLGLYYISPALSVDTILEKMQHCNTFITEAMHGAIVADALRIPWCAVAYGPKFLNFKWEDWTSVLDIEAVIHRLPFVLSGDVANTTVLAWKAKRFFGSFGIGKEKWHNFPKIYANNKNKHLLLDTLTDLKNSNSFQLSSDQTVKTLDNKLDAALQYLRRNY